MRLALVLLAAALPALGLRAQEYPAKALHLVVPLGAGAPSDVIARLLAQRLADAFHQPVMVENRPGVSGAPESVARSPHDGYTLLQGVETLILHPLMYKVAYDPFRDFTPISLTTREPAAIGIHPSIPARSLAELIAYGKSNPGQLNLGASDRMAAELFRRVTGLDAQIIMYKGAAPAVTDAIRGVVQISVSNLGAFLPYLRSERLRVLAVADAARYPLLPDLPAASETLPGYESSGWTALLGPAGLPQGVVSRLHSEIMKAVHNPSMRERLEQSGSIPVGSSPDELAQWMRAGYEKWRRMTVAAGVGPDS
jgi:tripartite-type tricarboxylate transporter receptor subunit TctC